MLETVITLSQAYLTRLIVGESKKRFRAYSAMGLSAISDANRVDIPKCVTHEVL